MKQRKYKNSKERIKNRVCKWCENPLLNKKSTGCNECNSKYYHRYKNKPYMSNEKQKNYRKMVRTEVLIKYGNKCNCCGESRWEFLAIDHINGDGNKERIKRLGTNNAGCSSHMFYLKLRKEPKRDDLQVLCHNCNQSFGHYGYSPGCPSCKRKINSHF